MIDKESKLRKVIERGMKLVLIEIEDESLQKALLIKFLDIREMLDGKRPSIKR